MNNNSRSTPNTPTMSKNQSMSTASPIVVAPSPSSANTPSKPFDDSCFKTPLPPTNKKGRPPRSRVNHGNRSNGHQHESPAPKSTGRGSRGGRGGRGAAAVSKGPQRGGRARIVPQKPPPPPKSFKLHDMFCPKTNVFLKKFKLPKIASLPPERRPRIKEERFVKQEPAEDQPSCSTAGVKNEVVDLKPDVSSNQPGTSKTNSPTKEVKTEPQQRLRPRLARRMFPPGEKKLPFVQELIIDEFSLLTFTCREDERLFAHEVRRRKAIYDAKRRKFQLERIRKINRIKRRIRRKKKASEKLNRSARKRTRALKRDRLRRARKEKHAALKKAVREAKANGTLTSELKKLWKAEKEKCEARREELRKRKVEHEARKEARRVKREKEYRKKGKKRRGRRAAKKAREKKLKEKQPKTARGRKMKDPGPALVEPAGAATLKRPSSKTPSPIPHKTSRIDDPYRNGIIGIAKSDSSASTPMPIVATPPGLLPPRTPLSVESKPHTTSSESAHPSDPGHRAPSAALVPQGHPGSSLFVNTSSAANSLLTPANPMNPLHALDPMRLAAAAAGNPFLAGAGVNIPFLQMLQQQQLQQLGNNPSAAAALLQAAGAHGAAGGLPFPPHAALGSQLAASAALLGRSIPAPTLKKPGRWCGMHVKIAQEVQAARKIQDARNVEAARHPQQAQDPALLAQQQALAAAAAHHQQQQRQPPQPPHCLPSTSCAPPPGLAGLSSLQQQQALAGMNPQMLNALHQEAARIAAATPKPPTAGLPPGLTPQRPPSTMPPRQPGLPQGLGQLGIPGLAASLAAGLPLAPPSSTAGSLTNGTSEQAALLQLMMQAQQQQQQAQAQAQAQAAQHPQQHLLAQREQQVLQQQQQAAAAAHGHPGHPGIPVSVPTSLSAGLLAQQHLLQQQQQHQQQQQQQQQQQVAQAQQALRLADPTQQLLQMQLMQQLDPRAAAIIAAAQQQAQAQQHHAQQQQQQQGGAPTTTSSGVPQTQLDLLRAHMEQQQQQQQLLLAAQQAAAQQQQGQGAPASTAAQDPREAMIRQMMLGQQVRGGQFEALLAAQQAAVAQRLPPGLQGLPQGAPTTQPQVSQPPSSVAASQAQQLFQSGMMGLQLPTTFKQMPYASQLQQFSQQMKQEAPTSTAPPAAAVPNGR